VPVRAARPGLGARPVAAQAGRAAHDTGHHP